MDIIQLLINRYKIDLMYVNPIFILQDEVVPEEVTIEGINTIGGSGSNSPTKLWDNRSNPNGSILNQEEELSLLFP